MSCGLHRNLDAEYKRPSTEAPIADEMSHGLQESVCLEDLESLDVGRWTESSTEFAALSSDMIASERQMGIREETQRVFLKTFVLSRL